jgi:hypothetical protein
MLEHRDGQLYTSAANLATAVLTVLNHKVNTFIMSLVCDGERLNGVSEKNRWGLGNQLLV